MKSLIYICGLCLCATLFSCTQNITVDLGEYESKIVVHGILQPGELPRIYLTRSVPYFEQINDIDSRYNFIKNAKVAIIHDGNSETLTLKNEYDRNQSDIFDNEEDSALVWFYEGSTPALENETYQLSVQADGQNITANTTIPSVVPMTTAEADFEVEEFFSESDTLQGIRVNFNDPAGLGDAYRLAYSFREQVLRYDDNQEIPDTVLVNTSRVMNRFELDEGRDGEEISIFEYFFPSSWYSERTDTFNITVRLQHVETDLADYLSSLLEQEYSEGDPFVEPHLIHSNIEGGLGVFGSYAPSAPDSLQIIFRYR